VGARHRTSTTAAGAAILLSLAAGGGIDPATGEEKLSEADLAAFAHADPLAMLEAQRPLIGPAETDEQGREIGGIIMLHCS